MRAIAETIAATNPCGEQPLPPYGACLLGSVNLARLVRDPFGPEAALDEDALDDLVSKIQGINLEVIIAVGHTDSVGSDAYNQKLSLKRAEAVKAYLTGKGIEANRVYTEGKGEKQPIADNRTAEGRAKNRRVEIKITPVTQDEASAAR